MTITLLYKKTKKFPIEALPRTRRAGGIQDPPRFRWYKVVIRPSGERVVISQEGELPAAVEEPLLALLGVAEGLEKENARLLKQCESLSKDAEAAATLVAEVARLEGEKAELERANEEWARKYPQAKKGK